MMLLFAALGMAVNAQLIDYNYTYGSAETHFVLQDMDRNLLKSAEIRLLKLIEQYPDAPTSDLDIFTNANIDLQNGNYTVALKNLAIFTKERHNSPFVASAHLLSGYIEFEQKNYPNSEKHFLSAVNSAIDDKKNREDIQYYNEIEHAALYWTAVSLSHQGRYLDAIPYFETASKNFADGIYTPSSIYALGTIAEMNKDYNKAMGFYDMLYSDYRYSQVIVAAFLRNANDALLLRNPQAAMLSIERAENAMAHINAKDSIGALYAEQDYYDKSKENVIYLKGEALNQTNNFDQAIEIFDSFIKKYSQSELIDHVYMGLGWAYIHKGDFQKAKGYYENVIASEIDEPRTKGLAHLYRVVCHKKLGETQEAQNELSMLAVAPNFPFLSNVLLELGQIYYEKGDYDLAARTLERAEREAGNVKIQIRIYALIAATYLELKQYGNAVNNYRKAEQAAKNSSDINVPNRKWYLDEARLKQGIALVLSQRSAEAIPPLLAYIAEADRTKPFDEATFWLGEAYYRSDMLKNAAETYSKVLDNYKGSKRREEAFYGMGWSYFRQQQFNKSSEAFDKMIKEFPKSKYAVEVMARQGDGFYLVKQYDKAVECYRRAAKLDPQSEDGQYSAYQMAHALYRLNKYEQSITALLDFVRVYHRSPLAPNSLYLIGWIRFQQGKYAEAVDNFNFLISTYPQSRLIPRAYYAIADAYYNMGNYDEAINGYKGIVEQFPSSDLAPEAMRSVQYAYMALGRDADAIAVADTYINTNPESPYIEDFRYKKAEMLYTGKRYTDAIAEFEAFSKNFPNSEKNAEALYWMGKSYASMNDFTNAAASFMKLYHSFAKDDYAAFGLLEYGLLLKQQNMVDSAAAIFKTVQDNYSVHEVAPQAGFERAIITAGKGDTLGGLAIFRDVADKYKETDYGDLSRYRLAMYYRMKEDYPAAIKDFEVIAEVYDSPDIAAESRYRIGELYLRMNQQDSAEASFAILQAKFAGYEDWYSLGMLSLGELYEKKDRHEEAKEIYGTILQLRPEDEFGKTAKTRLKRLK